MTMMQWKKPIRNNGGFTLVEQEPVYYSEDRIAM